LEAVGRGEFLISGLRNRDLQRLPRAHGLIHKRPHTHRYLVSEKGRQLIAMLHAAREADIEKLTKAS
jgi:hypothetical protein